MKKVHSLEKGQIVVLLALALIALLAFTALAIDGGMIYADQRFSQSAADAASLAGGGAAASVVQNEEITLHEWNCDNLGSSKSAAVDAAKAKAEVNGYIIDYDNELGTAGHDHGVKVTCYDAGEYMDVEVMLSRVTQTSFVHLINGEEMRTTAYSKTRVRPLLKAGNGDAIVGLGKDCGKQGDGGVHFDSASLVAVLINGGVYSNDCVLEHQNDNVTIQGAGVTCHEGADCTFTDPNPVTDTEYHPLTYMEGGLYPWLGDSCGDSAYIDSNGEGGKIGPGNYNEWNFRDPVRLQPGLYCVKGDVKMHAGGSVWGDGVTIYYTGTDLTLNGNVDTWLNAPNTGNGEHDIEPQDGAVEDLLLYVPPDIEASIKINGTSNNTFGGTLYAPGSNYKITGTSDSAKATNMDVSIIGKTVWITGDSNLHIAYKDDRDAGTPAYIQVQK